ncbi:hypothetical protein [Kitasatospora phosalacinea]|uniref:Fibronectin type-III domain-containing protein n=1 Tax=Kitasatospora phosalacinea TaxID=2065 RepID=A0ABW6GJM2_9ACTN
MVTAHPGGRSARVGADLRETVLTGLDDGTAYELDVAAVNYRLSPDTPFGDITLYGRYTAPAANAVVTVLAFQAASADCPARTGKAVLLVGATKPDPATGLTTARDGHQVRLDWKPPAFDGGGGPVEYAVIASYDRPEPTALVVLRTTATGTIVPTATRDPFQPGGGPEDADRLREAGARYTVVAANRFGAAAAPPPVRTL